MKNLSLPLAGIVLSAFFSLHLSADNNPPPAPTTAAKPLLYETAKTKGADVQIQEDAQALGGEYVMNHQAYNPVFILNTPPGDQFTVWAHIRGSSFQLKGVVNGKQQELDWMWGSPGPFVWKKFGTYTRDKLGDQIVIIRGDKADPTDGIDAVILAPTTDFNPDLTKNIETLLVP